MATKDYEFTVGKGHMVWAEKSHYPDLVRLVIPKDQALELAQKILRQLEHVRPDQTHLGEIALFGQLEEFDDEYTEIRMGESVKGLPTAWDWCLLGDTDEENEQVAAELNVVLAQVLERAKRENLAPWDLVDVLYPEMDALDAKYPGIGILDTEGRETMAIFFAENYREDAGRYVMWRSNHPF